MSGKRAPSSTTVGRRSTGGVGADKERVREATLLLQNQARVLTSACDALVARDAARAAASIGARARTVDEWMPIVEPILRVFVAIMAGAPIHGSTLSAIRGAVSLDDRDATATALSDALRALGVEGAALQHADAELRSTLGVSLGLVDDTPRPSIVTALASVSSTGAAVAAAPPPRALLRLRAHTVDAAHALIEISRRIPVTTEESLANASADEIVVTTTGEPKDGVARLVRVAAQWFRALDGQLDDDVAGAIVLVDAPGDARAVRAAMVRAGQGLKRTGLLSLDEAAFSSAEGLAEHPSHPRHIVPGAAFGHDRWQHSALLSKTPMIGRDDEARAVAEALAASSDASMLVVVQGAAGLGKSTVLRHALAAAGYADPRAPVLWGAADPLQPTPYAPIAAMLRALAGTHVGTLHAGARLHRFLVGLADLLPAPLGQELLSLEKILAFLIGAADDDDDERLEREVEDLSPRALRVAVRRALLLVVDGLRARAAHRPAALVVSGADAIDAPTIDLLTFLARRLAGDLRVVFLSSTRMRLPRALVEAFAVSRVDLAPLDGERSLEVLRAIMDDEGEAAHLAPLIEKAKGSPLALSQTLRFAVEGGLVSHDGRRFVTGPMRASAIPARIERTIAARVARLPDVARRTLGFASVLGAAFMPAAVEVIGVRAGIAREEIARALHLLIETGFLVKSGRRPAAPVFDDDGVEHEDPLLCFEHPLLRTVVERSLDEAELRRVHALAAEALLALLPSGTRAIAVQLARHFRVAGERARALSHLALAVRRAVRLNNRSGAITMAKEGQKLVGEADVDRHFVFQLELERALEQGNDREAHKVALKDLVRAADRTQDPRRQGQALQRVARFNVFGGDHEKAEAAALKALERMRACEDKRGQAQALRVLALARFEMRRFDAAKDALASARALLAADDVRSLAILDHQLGLMHLEAGDAVVALEHLMDALLAKRESGDPAGECACMNAIADAYVRLGRLHTAALLLERAVELSARLGDEAGRAESTKSLAEVMLALGDAVRAHDLASSAQRLARTLDLERLERGSAMLAARAKLMQNDPIAAEHVVETVRRRVEEKRDPFGAMESALLSAQAKLARAARAGSTGARDRLLKTALERARRASELGESHAYASGQVLGAALIGAVLHAQGDHAGALVYAQRASELVDERRQTGMPVEDVLLTYARVLHAMGDVDDAKSVVDRATASLDERAARLPSALRAQFWSVGNRAVLRALKGHLDGVVSERARSA